MDWERKLLKRAGIWVERCPHPKANVGRGDPRVISTCSAKSSGSVFTQAVFK